MLECLENNVFKYYVKCIIILFKSHIYIYIYIYIYICIEYPILNI